MGELIPSIKISDFKLLKANQIRAMKSVELLSDGEYVCTIIVPQTDFIKQSSFNNGQLSNAVGGKDLEEILNVSLV